MSFEYLSVADAIQRPGLRMVVVGKVPSPWGEAAKGIFHIKNIEWAAVRLVYDDDSLKEWAGERSGPVAVYDREPPRSDWKDILTLAERLAPTPPLLPATPAARELVLSLSEKFCGKNGLGWHRRLQAVNASLQQSGGFSERVAGYLGKKYGYDPARASEHGPQVRGLLGEFAALLRAQPIKPYYLGDTLSALDVYSATFMAMFKPLPESQCAMDPRARAAFEALDDETRAALDPILLAHRDMMYARHLEMPLSL
jgi:glutathione S-transferase